LARRSAIGREGGSKGASQHSLLGIQTWVALPESKEDVLPSFEHHGKGTLPMIEHDGGNVRLILGRAYGETAPTSVFSETFYAMRSCRRAPAYRYPMITRIGEFTSSKARSRSPTRSSRQGA
jgi:redox-sensitive bicupin YhaK (pirin superfamily)